MRTIQHKRGLKANLPELASGELGFTTDEGILYVGSPSGNMRVSYSAQIITTLLNVGGWANGKYSFEETYPSASYDVEVSYNDDNYSAASFEAWNDAQISGSPTANVMTARGTIPSVDIPVFLKVVKK